MSDFPRFIEYFLVVGAKLPLQRPRTFYDRNVEGGIWENISSLKFEGGPWAAEVISCVPAVDRPGLPLPGRIVDFCCPTAIQCTSTVEPRLLNGVFVITMSENSFLYGVTLTFYENEGASWLPAHLPPLESDSSQAGRHKVRDLDVYVPKTLCILSEFPFFRAFQQILYGLYRFVNSTAAQLVSVESVLLTLVEEIVVPLKGGPRISIRFGNGEEETEVFAVRPSRKCLPLLDFSLRYLFECLSVSEVLHVISLLLLEQQVVVVCASRSQLAVICESLRVLLFPFKWSYLYLSGCPVQLLPKFMSSSLPFLIGVDFVPASICIPESVHLVNCDEGVITSKIKCPVISKALVEAVEERVCPILSNFGVRKLVAEKKVEVEVEPENDLDAVGSIVDIVGIGMSVAKSGSRKGAPAEMGVARNVDAREKKKIEMRQKRREQVNQAFAELHWALQDRSESLDFLSSTTTHSFLESEYEFDSQIRCAFLSLFCLILCNFRKAVDADGGVDDMTLLTGCPYAKGFLTAFLETDLFKAFAHNSEEHHHLLAGLLDGCASTLQAEENFYNGVQDEYVIPPPDVSGMGGVFWYDRFPPVFLDPGMKPRVPRRSDVEAALEERSRERDAFSESLDALTLRVDTTSTHDAVRVLLVADENLMPKPDRPTGSGPAACAAGLILSQLVPKARLENVRLTLGQNVVSNIAFAKEVMQRTLSVPSKLLVSSHASFETLAGFCERIVDSVAAMEDPSDDDLWPIIYFVSAFGKRGIFRVVGVKRGSPEREFLQQRFGKGNFKAPFSNMRVWNIYFFDRVQEERTELYQKRFHANMDEVWKSLSREEREDCLVRERELIFNLIGESVTEMLSLGVSKVDANVFVEKMASVYELGDGCAPLLEPVLFQKQGSLHSGNQRVKGPKGQKG